jgi:hypothetical protein
MFNAYTYIKTKAIAITKKMIIDKFKIENWHEI